MQLRYQFAHRQNCILGKCDRPHSYPEKRGTARWALTTVLRFREILKHSNTASFILSFPELVPGSLAASKYIPPTATPGDQFRVAAVSESSAF